MKSFKQLDESHGFAKGWVHKTGKMFIWKSFTPYHVQFLVNNLSKFGMRKSSVMTMLKNKYNQYDSPTPEEDAEEYFEGMKTGYNDIYKPVEWLAMKKGWCRVVLDPPYPGMGGIDLKTLHQCAEHLDKKYASVFNKSQRGSIELEIFEVRNRKRPDDYDIDRIRVDGTDWDAWVKRGGHPDRLPRRTEIGATMAMFRESFLTEAPGKYAQVLFKDDMDFTNPEIQVFGLGVYTLESLRRNMSMKLEDLSKRLVSSPRFVHKQITDSKSILHNFAGALNDVENEMRDPRTKRKITMMKKKR